MVKTAVGGARYILAINAGSSSIKAVLYEYGDGLSVAFQGVVEQIGQPSSNFMTDNGPVEASAGNHDEAENAVIDWLESKVAKDSIVAVGHRIVHGGPEYSEPIIITPELLNDLREISSFDPDHLPIEIKTVEKFKGWLHDATHVACFDTDFFQDLPKVAKTLPIPRQYQADGLRRYGFHGLSYAYLLYKLRELEGDKVANGKVIFAHLGSGVSLAATTLGKPFDTTMSFTPASGVMMSTRSGDLDPGIALFMQKRYGMNLSGFNNMVNHESGLLGVSGLTSDMRELLQKEQDNPDAAEAVEMFCYEVKKAIGALAAAIGGVDALVFAGGMGERAPIIRSRICRGLEFLGIELDESKNLSNEAKISPKRSRAVVRVIPTDEELVIGNFAMNTLEKLNTNGRKIDVTS